MLLLCFSLANAIHTIFKAVRSTYENSCCLEWISVFSQAVFFFSFFVIIGILLFSRVCLFADFVCEDEKEEKRVRGGQAGGNGAFDFLFTLGTIETQRCERICDIESVLITKTGIKGD